MVKCTMPLSLCMIVNNDEKVLARCLNSVRSLVREIIVVDTGSTDASKDIAREFGAVTLEFPWHNKIAEARIFSLDQATSDWILVLDADEVLVYDSEKDFRRLLEDPAVEGYFAKVVNLLGSPTEFETSEDLAIRLFRCKSVYRFQGNLFGEIRPGIAGTAGEKTLKRAPLTIYHDGYLSDLTKRK